MVKNYDKTLIFFIWTLCTLYYNAAAFQGGPDPWNLEDNRVADKLKNDIDIPPDLKILPKKRVETTGTLGNGEWFFRRILGILLKGGQFKQNEDGSVDISLQMKVSENKWKTLDEVLKSQTPLSDDMYRRSLGYIEEAIYQPSITDKIVMAWGDYVQVYLSEYKTEIVWTLAILAVAGLLFWLWNHMSHRQLVGIIFIMLYIYEVFISYKEAEKQDLDKFLTAVNSCKWYNVFSSKCEVPKPDLINFFKHMNPLKIAIRMFTTVISEPMIVLSETLKTLVHGITDGLWYPFDKIAYALAIVTFNVLLMVLLITIACNYIFNLPMDLGYLGMNLSLKQRRRNIIPEATNEGVTNIQNGGNAIENNHTDRISGTNLQRILDICARALNAAHSNSNNNNQIQITDVPNNNVGLRRSASTGRLPNSNEDVKVPAIAEFRRRNVRVDGGGDAKCLVKPARGM